MAKSPTPNVRQPPCRATLSALAAGGACRLHGFEQRRTNDPEAEDQADQADAMEGSEHQPLNRKGQNDGQQQQPPQRLGGSAFVSFAAPPNGVHSHCQKNHQGNHGHQEHHREYRMAPRIFCRAQAPRTPAARAFPTAPVPRRPPRFTLLTSRKNSRDKQLESAGVRKVSGARQAYRVSEPPMVSTRNARMYRPRVGSLA